MNPNFDKEVATAEKGLAEALDVINHPHRDRYKHLMFMEVNDDLMVMYINKENTWTEAMYVSKKKGDISESFIMDASDLIPGDSPTEYTMELDREANDDGVQIWYNYIPADKETIKKWLDDMEKVSAANSAKFPAGPITPWSH